MTVVNSHPDFYRQDWEKGDDDTAVVDVDVRGWVFAPHRGPMTRKHKILIGLARQLAGVPAPGKSPTASASSSRSSSPHGFKERADKRSSRQEEEIAVREAESIVKRGEAEADAAGKGAYSEKPSDEDPAPNPQRNRQSFPNVWREEYVQASIPPSSRHSSLVDESLSGPSQRAGSWSNASQMSPAELAVANMHLMSRIQPFLANPLMNIPISAFFYNDDMSRQKTVDTDASGHFSVRASLDFIPTHVRILASEKLSATEEVRVTEPRGMSVISDVDDTIKHSAISSGAKEIFRNVFVRELGDLSIKGVKEWYQEMYDMGSMFHYVSNSPWQVFPILKRFFEAAGLPPGSFHLKQYNGMFQGIFEPVAERKKSTLDKIMADFPERRFLLIGDSGEADLEVYTDVVCENPGRILGVFIRDVTTSSKKGFFNPVLGPLSPNDQSKFDMNSVKKAKSNPNISRPTRRHSEDDPAIKEAITRSLADQERMREERPVLPPRMPTAPVGHEEDLIDLDFDDKSNHQDEPEPKHLSHSQLHPAPPPRPQKPRSLSSTKIDQLDPSSQKYPPPLPRKPSTSVRVPQTSQSPSVEGKTLHDSLEDRKPEKPPRPLPPPQRLTYRSAARQRLSDAYYRLPSPSAYAFGQQQQQAQSSGVDTESNSETKPSVPPPKPALISNVPPTSYPGHSSKASISSRYGGTSARAYQPTDSYQHGYGYGGGASTSYPISKKEELWKRRWARAKAILDEKGVVLRSWRVGSDVMRDAVELVEDAICDEDRR